MRGDLGFSAWEHVFVSIKGSSYVRFRRALATGNPTIVSAAAAELPQLTLADALAVTLVYLLHDPARFDRALVRWHARYCLETRSAAAESQLVLAALRALDGPTRESAAQALADVLDRRGLRDAARELDDLIRE